MTQKWRNWANNCLEKVNQTYSPTSKSTYNTLHHPGRDLMTQIHRKFVHLKRDVWFQLFIDVNYFIDYWASMNRLFLKFQQSRNCVLCLTTMDWMHLTVRMSHQMNFVRMMTSSMQCSILELWKRQWSFCIEKVLA